MEVLKTTAADRLEFMKQQKEDAAKIAELQQKMIELDEQVREKEGINMVIKEEMTAQKRAAFLNKSRA